MSDGMQQISNGFKIVGETLLPGSSLLMDGRVKEGGAHMVAGLAARVVIGPIGWGVVAANSYIQSVTDQSIVGLVGSYAGDARDAFKRKGKSDADAEVVEAEEVKPTASAAKGASAKA